MSVACEKGLGAQLKAREDELVTLQAELNAMLMGIPNLPHDSVPDGSGEDDNLEIRRWGELPHFVYLRIMYAIRSYYE